MPTFDGESLRMTASLIPRSVFFGNAERDLPQISPDGTRLAYLATDPGGVQQVWVQPLGETQGKLVSRSARRPVGLYRWAQDGEHILYLQDSDGDENWHVFSVMLKTGAIRDLTPFIGVRSQNLLTSPMRPNEILIGMNLRLPRVFDMYRVDLRTGGVTLDTENPGDVLSWTTDRHFVIRAATAFDLRTGETFLRVRDSAQAPWRNLIVWPFEQSSFCGQVNGGSVTAGFAPDGKSLYVLSFLQSERARMERVDAATGETLEVVAEHPNADVAHALGVNVEAIVLREPKTGALEAVAFEYLEPEWKFMDPRVQADFEQLGKTGNGFWRVVNSDAANTRWIVARQLDDRPTRFYLYDRVSRAATLLFADTPSLEKLALVHKSGVIIPARDGLPLVSYLTLPAGVDARKLPMVLFVHGGPWARDSWEIDPVVQLLANRGYAVLQVNYRGSTGFGKKFFNAGNHEFGLGMQEDLNDAVRWAIREGIADPKRIAIMGYSVGGYATLRAVTETPELFACGVDIVGPSDMARFFRSMPASWEAVKTRWVRRIGDVEHDDELNRRLSPLYHANKIRVPMLIGQGANDTRVNIENSNRMVAAMRENNVPVTYIVYPDEGHGFGRPENNLDFFGRVEEFLATCLGGRAEPWTKIDRATAEVR